MTKLGDFFPHHNTFKYFCQLWLNIGFRYWLNAHFRYCRKQIPLLFILGLTQAQHTVSMTAPVNTLERKTDFPIITSEALETVSH